MVARCWEAARTQPCCCNGSHRLHPSSFAGAQLVCPQGMVFRQEEATDAPPELGSCHASEAATTACPALGEPGLWSDGPQARPAAKWGLAPRLVQCREGALCSYADRMGTRQLGNGVLGSWGLLVLVLVGDGGGQGLSPPAAGAALRCYQRWEPGEPPSRGAGERQGFPQAPSLAVLMAGVPILYRTSTQNCSGG